MMSSLSIAYKNLIHRPLGPILSTLLIALSVGLMVFSMRIQDQVENRFSSNLAEIDMVLSAKGSPLQSILCNLFHLDSPTGNILIKDAAPHLRPQHPFIETAIPLSLGDNYAGYRIVGTTVSFFQHYKLKLAEGNPLTENNTVILGSEVAQNLSLKIGSTFDSGHGIRDEGFGHEHGGQLKVVGILEIKNNVTDQLIFTLPSTVWAQHEHQSTENQTFPLVRSNEELLQYEDRDITSVLLTFTGQSMQVLNFARNVNVHTKIMASNPAIEINRLYLWMGSGMDIAKILAWAILFISTLSIFLSQWMTIKERISDMALIRMMGGSRWTVSKIILLESLIIAVLGLFLGWAISMVSFTAINPWLKETYHMSIPLWELGAKELKLAILIVLISISAVVIPGWRLYRLPLSKALNAK